MWIEFRSYEFNHIFTDFLILLCSDSFSSTVTIFIISFAFIIIFTVKYDIFLNLDLVENMVKSKIPEILLFREILNLEEKKKVAH